MLTSAGLGRRTGVATSARFDAELSKPVKQSDLLDAIVDAVRARRLATAADARTANQRVAAGRERARSACWWPKTTRPIRSWSLALLESAAAIASTVGRQRPRGRRDARRSNAFDVILMDVQMPEMSGLEATAAIRERERDTGGHVPIVAHDRPRDVRRSRAVSGRRAWTPTSRNRCGRTSCSRPSIGCGNSVSQAQHPSPSPSRARDRHWTGRRCSRRLADSRRCLRRPRGCSSPTRRRCSTG